MIYADDGTTPIKLVDGSPVDLSEDEISLIQGTGACCSDCGGPLSSSEQEDGSQLVACSNAGCPAKSA